MLYDNPLWIEDIDTVSKIVAPELEELSGHSVLITGASGLICSAIVDVLFRYNDLHHVKIKILAAGRSFEKMRNRFGNMVDRDDFSFIYFDAVKSNNRIDEYADYIIHGAGNAYPAKITKEPVETMLANILGTRFILDYAKNKDSKRILYISSSEVYGKKENNQPFTEVEYGYIDILNPRNSYSCAKRAAETLCISYAAEYGVDTIIIRPGHIYGPTASSDDNRVSSSWAYSAAYGENIVMKSDGSQIRSYCYCLDCASAILKVLLNGETSKAYNISNPDSVISIRELADIISKYGKVAVRLDSPALIDKKGFNLMSNSSLDSIELINIGWKSYFNANNGLAHTISILKELQK